MPRTQDRSSAPHERPDRSADSVRRAYLTRASALAVATAANASSAGPSLSCRMQQFHGHLREGREHSSFGSGHIRSRVPGQQVGGVRAARREDHRAPATPANAPPGAALGAGVLGVHRLDRTPARVEPVLHHLPVPGVTPRPEDPAVLVLVGKEEPVLQRDRPRSGRDGPAVHRRLPIAIEAGARPPPRRLQTRGGSISRESCTTTGACAASARATADATSIRPRSSRKASEAAGEVGRRRNADEPQTRRILRPAVQGRRERSLLRRRATEDAEMRRSQ